MSWVPARRRDELRALASRSQQVVALAAVVGVTTGLVVALFDRVVIDAMFDHVSELDPYLIAVMPGLGLVVSLVVRRHVGGRASPSTADEYLRAFHDRSYVLSARVFAARMLAAVATLGSGGPMGLEGPSLYSGAFIGSRLQGRLPRVFRDADERVLLVAGAAAGVAAIFKAPATGAVFALFRITTTLPGGCCFRLSSLRRPGTSRSWPSMAPGACSRLRGGTGFGYLDLLGAVSIGVIAGLGARGFAWLIRAAKRAQQNRHSVIVAVGAGALIAGLFAVGRILTGESLLVGPGYDVVAWASDPGRSVWVLLAILALRSLATPAVVAGGGGGGLFVPLVVTGALTGAAVGNIVDAGAMTLFIVIGVAAFLGAGYRVPLASMMFVAETTGRPSFVVPGLLAAVAAELVMGPSSVTSYQVGATRPFSRRVPAPSPTEHKSPAIV